MKNEEKARLEKGVLFCITKNLMFCRKYKTDFVQLANGGVVTKKVE